MTTVTDNALIACGLRDAAAEASLTSVGERSRALATEAEALGLTVAARLLAIAAKCIDAELDGPGGPDNSELAPSAVSAADG